MNFEALWMLAPDRLIGMSKRAVNNVIAVAGVIALVLVTRTDLVGDRLTAVLVVLTLAAALVGVNMQWPRMPLLTLFYRVHGTTDQNILPASDRAIQVWIENTGRGLAEAMEAEFRTLGGRIDHPGLLGLPVTQSGPGAVQRWYGRGRVLNPKEEIMLVTLNAPSGTSGSRWGSAPNKVAWKARAKGMSETAGVIELRYSNDA